MPRIKGSNVLPEEINPRYRRRCPRLQPSGSTVARDGTRLPASSTEVRLHDNAGARSRVLAEVPSTETATKTKD